MSEFTLINRRLFLRQLGRGSLAAVVLSTCARPESSTTTSTGVITTSSVPTTGASASTGTSTAPTTSAVTSEGSRFERVNLGFVSAYIVVRGSEAAIVDTGVAGSEGDIETAMGQIGIGWDQVGHVIVTHRHPDHAGSAPAVMTAAANATGYTGEADLASITAPRELTGLVDGDTVFGLDVIATPGHTAGHICLLDPIASVLLAGDALIGEGGGVAEPSPDFSADHDQALASVAKLALLTYEQILFGHGEPVTAGGSGLVAELAG